jgi:hypothetical protein
LTPQPTVVLGEVYSPEKLGLLLSPGLIRPFCYCIQEHIESNYTKTNSIQKKPVSVCNKIFFASPPSFFATLILKNIN